MLHSKEGVTQGVPLSMFIYAVSSLPLISSLQNNSKWKQIWYADDATSCGKIKNLRVWFDQLIEMAQNMDTILNNRRVF